MHRTLAALILVGALTSLAAPAAAQDGPPNSSLAPTEPYTADTWRLMIPAEEYARGLRAVRDKRYRTAIHALGRLVDAKPKTLAAWRLLGVAYAGQSDWTASRRAYERALHLAPDDVTSHAGRGAALQALNDPRAQQEAQWLKARTEACGDTCPDAAILKTLQARGPFAVTG